MASSSKPQLQMVLPETVLSVPPTPEPAAGYELRCFQLGDMAEYIALMASAGFGGWDADGVKGWLRRVLPRGFFVITAADAAGLPVATAMAVHNPSDLHPYGGELGWVAGRSEHAGRGLGIAICAAVIRRFAQAGYDRVYLQTDDERLPAIKVYLKLGFVPFLYQRTMLERWREVCETLGWPFTPESWPTHPEPPPSLDRTDSDTA